MFSSSHKLIHFDWKNNSDTQPTSIPNHRHILDLLILSELNKILWVSISIDRIFFLSIYISFFCVLSLGLLRRWWVCTLWIDEWILYCCGFDLYWLTWFFLGLIKYILNLCPCLFLVGCWLLKALIFFLLIDFLYFLFIFC